MSHPATYLGIPIWMIETHMSSQMTLAEQRVRNSAARSFPHTLDKFSDKMLDEVIQNYKCELEKAERTPGSFEQYRENLRNILVMALAEKMRRSS